MPTVTATIVNPGNNSVVINQHSTATVLALKHLITFSNNLGLKTALRFPQVTVPDGKFIESAKIKLYCTAANIYTGDMNVSFFGKDAPNPYYISNNPPFFTNRPLPSTRLGTSSKLTAPVNPLTSGAASPYAAPFNALRHADITAIVKTLYSKYSYSSPSAMTFIGICADPNDNIFAYPKSLGSTKDPELIIKYTEPPLQDKTIYEFI